MAKGFWVKEDRYDPNSWRGVGGFFVKVSPSTWQTVNDAWIKVKQTGTDAWQRFWSSATNPDSPIEILTSYTSPGELLRLQGKNYHWTPAPSTLFYTFSYVDNTTNTTKTLTSSTSTSNPSTGSSITVPSSSTYRTISKSSVDGEYAIGGLSTYKFTVTGTTSGGSTSVQTAEYSMRTPKAPTLAVERLSNTSVKIAITGATSEDFNATYTYIVSTYDAIGGTIVSGGGRGGHAATLDPTYVTLTGLTAGRLYYIYVTPFTGSAGSTEANATGYAGITANTTTQGEADYAFSFGNTLHVGTNGYVSLDSGNVNDAISSTTGRVIGIFPGDLYQDTTTSVWYWSDTTRFIIRWEGYHYNQPSNLRQYEIVFNTGANYASVYAINVANTTEGTEAYVKDGIAKTNYAAALGTGSWRYVYFDGVTAPTSQFGPYAPTSKSVMKQVAGLTAGTQDQGYTSIVTSTNQNVTPTLGAFNVSSFTKGTVGSSSQGASRTTSLSWGASSGATAYQVQYQGSNDNVNWTTVQGYSATNNISGTTDSKTWSTSGGNFSYYTFMRANVRSLESTGTATYVYSNGGSYTEASGVAPGQPTFGTITQSGTTASVPFTVGTQGSNYLYTSIEYQYRASSGSYSGSWSTSVINTGAGTISLTGLSSSTTYYIKIRTRNYDELYSPENETSFTTPSVLTAPTITSVSSTIEGAPVTAYFSGGSGPYYQIYWTTGAAPTFNATPDAEGSSSPLTDSTGPATTGFTYYMYVRSVSSLGYTVPGPSSLASAWSSGYSFTVASANLTAPTISFVSAGNVNGPVSVYFSGGTGPFYQAFWWGTASGPTVSVTADASGSSSPLTDNTGPSSNATQYMYVRSVKTAGETSVGPSTLASTWSSGVSFNMTQPPIIPTITMGSNTGVGQSGATINWSSTNQSYATVDGVNVGNVTSYAFTGKSASTTYSGTVVVYSSTGNSASASYSFTTSASFTIPTSVAPSLQFLRTSASSRLDWYCDYPGISGNGTITGMDFEIRTTAGGGTLLASGTRAYPGAGTYPYSAAGTIWAFRMGTANSDISYSASARYGRARVVMLGSNGTTYYGTWSGWI